MLEGKYTTVRPHACWAHPAIRDLTLVPEHVPGLIEFIEAVWDAPPGVRVAVPPRITTEHANSMTSVIKSTKDQWERQGGVVDIKVVAETRGSRFNNGKTRFDLIDWEALTGLADVLEFGAKKYSNHNWRRGLPFTEIIASLLRHVSEIMKNQDIDPETQLLHADHIQCNAMFLSWMIRNRPDMDDRWKHPVVDKS